MVEHTFPPMASGGLPVLGHALQFLRNPTALMEQGYHEHGPVFSLQLATRRAVVLLGPENNRFFFSETDKLLSIRESYPFFIKMFHERFYLLAEFRNTWNSGPLFCRGFSPSRCTSMSPPWPAKRLP